MIATLRDLKAGRSALIPRYDFVTSSRHPESLPVDSADIILFDGILAFYSAGACCGTSQSCRMRTWLLSHMQNEHSLLFYAHQAPCFLIGPQSTSKRLK